jgi:rhomboid protease GluP
VTGVNGDILIWIVLAPPAIVVLFQPRTGWGRVAAAILLLGIAALIVIPDHAAVLILVAWLILILQPFLLAGRVAAAVARLDYRRALRFAAAIRVLHPMDGWPGQVRLFRALSWLRLGQWDKAEPVLIHIAEADPSSINRLSAMSHLCRWRDDWSPLVATPPPADDYFATVIAIRALAELGRLDEMAALHEQARPRFGANPRFAQARLAVLAFGGRPAGVAALSRGPLSALPDDVRAFWDAVARTAAGDAEAPEGRALLTRLAESAPPDTAFAAKQRLARPPAQVASPSPALTTALNEAEREALATPPRRAAFRPWATAVLILAICAVYALELARGGTENTQVLFRLGAPTQGAVLTDHALWRLAVGLFLHVGPVHLGINLLTLFFLGIVLERMLGAARFLTLYFVTGLGSMAGAIWLMRAMGAPNDLLAGASGALMGLAGGFVAILAARLRGPNRRDAARRLAALAVVLLLQLAIDLTTPEISFSAHAVGFLLGFALGLLPRFRRAIVPPASWSAGTTAPGRPSVLGYLFVGLVFGSVFWLRAHPMDDPFDRGPKALAPEVVAGIRRLVFVNATNVPGSPTVAPFGPFGARNVFAELTRIAGAPHARTLYADILKGLPLFCARATLAPGRYFDGAGDWSFDFTADHAALIRNLHWIAFDPRTNHVFDPRTEPVSFEPAAPWPVDMADPDRPFGESQDWRGDMADILGILFKQDASGRAVLSDADQARVSRLRAELPVALLFFVRNAAWPGTESGPAPTVNAR